MSKSAEIIVRYDSPAIKDGFISLDVLGPSLLSLGMLCNRANQIVNGDQVKSTALVNANINQNCFELIFQLGLSFVEDLLGRGMTPNHTCYIGILTELSLPILAQLNLAF